MSISRRLFIAAACLMSSVAIADTPVELVVPFTAGGASDGYARLLAQALDQQLPTSVIVANRPGAGGSIGASHVARAKPDGNTVLLGTISTHAVNPSL